MSEPNYEAERQRFEAYAREILDQKNFSVDEDWAYNDPHLDAQWLGWIARAEWHAATYCDRE
jgi:hypothetical protein